MLKMKIMVLCVIISTLLIPYPTTSYSQSASLIKAEGTYSYKTMLEDIKTLTKNYPDLISYKTIGKSAYGRDLVAVKLGKGNANIMFNGSHHAREWITTVLLMKMIEEYAGAAKNNAAIGSYNVRDLLNETTLWFVPMVNPDGVTLQQFGAGVFPNDIRAYLISLNGGSENFQKWKADAWGVDPNRQYPADWANIRFARSYPSYMNYKGSTPLQTLETKAMVEFTREINPEVSTAYHSSGEIIFWHFHNKAENYNRDKNIVDTLSYMTGYTPVKPEPNPSGGGYTDWFIQEFGRPGLTIEVSDYAGEAAVPISKLNSIWDENKTVGLYLAEQGYKIWMKHASSTPINSPIELTELTPLFTETDENSGSNGALNDQKVHAVAKKGNWYQIETWQDLKWIKPKNALIGDTSSINMDISLARPVELYKLPLENSKLYTTILPQTVHATMRWNDWYKLKTWLGEVWIHYPEASKPSVSVVIDGVTQSYAQPAVIKDGSTIVPLRGIFENLGAKIDWNNENQTVTATKDGIIIKLTIGQKTADVNGNEMQLAVKAQIINDSTMVPLRFVSEALGAQVQWDANTATANITSAGKIVQVSSVQGDGKVKSVSP